MGFTVKKGSEKGSQKGFSDQKTFRYLWRFYSLLFRGFFVAFPWLFRDPLLSRKTVFGPFSWLFRGFFVAPVLGKIYAYSPWNSLLIRRGDSRSCLERPLGEYARLGVCPTFVGTSVETFVGRFVRPFVGSPCRAELKGG